MNRIDIKQIDTRIKRIEKDILYIKGITKRYDDIRETYRPRCKRCNVANVRLRRDGSYFCNSCGYESKIMEKKRK